MIVNPRTVDIDVTPSNAKVLLGAPSRFASIKSLADVVHAWVDAALTKSPLGVGAKGVNLGCLQAVTVSVFAPLVSFRVIADERVTDAEVEQFRLNCADALYHAARAEAQTAWLRSLSPETVDMCKMGPFEVKDLAEFIPDLHTPVCLYGERAVIARCQIARRNCGSAAQTIDCVLAYYRAPNDAARVMSEQARRALSPEERAAAFVSIGRNPDGSYVAAEERAS